MEPIDKAASAGAGGDVVKPKRKWSKPQISNINGPIVVKAHGDEGKIVVMDDAGETDHYRNPS